MKLLLTGATGFIGSSFYSNYHDRFEIETFSFQKDLNTLSINNIDTLVHLSALVHRMDGASDEAYHEVNVVKTVALAQKAKDAGVKQFIFMSTVKVYGEESSTPYTETTPCHPKDPYGESKLKAENALLSLENEAFKIAIIRTPVVYGEGVKANILKLIGLTEKYAYLPFGGVANRRSMVYVENLAHLISELVLQEEKGIFLASDDHPLSTTQLIRSIAEALNKKVLLFPCHILKLTLRLIKPTLYQRLYGNLFVDNTQTRTQLHLTNPCTSQEGIEKMITWYKDQKR
ncbi:MAG: NAD-dependent epimerase/dehydratase family protein [Campylobacterota bacterium]